MSDDLTADQITEYRDAFMMFDVDGSGAISTHELGSLMRSLGAAPTAAELEGFIDDVDVNGDGEVDFDEFLVLMEQQKNASDPMEELSDAFKIFEKDGRISMLDLYRVMSCLGDKLSPDDAMDFVKELPFDQDGFMETEELIASLMPKPDDDKK